MSEQKKKFNFDLNSALKLYKGGLIKEDTYKRIQKYADGGVVMEDLTKFDPMDMTAVEKAPTADQVRLDEIKDSAWLPGMDKEAFAKAKLEKEKTGMIPSEPLAPAPPEPEVELEAVEASPVQPQASDASGNPLGLMESAVMKGMEAGAAEATAVGQSIDKTTQAIQKAQEREQVMAAEQKIQLDDAQKKVDLAYNEYASAKLDPDRFWANKSTGQKIGLAIGLFFSGVNGSKTGVEILNNAIDRDLEAQRAAIGTKKENVQNQRGILSDMMAKFGDERQALAAAKLTQIQMAELQLKKQAAKVQGTRAEIDAMEGMARLGLLKQKAQQDFNAATILSPGYRSNVSFQQQFLSLPENMRNQAVKLPGGKLGIAMNDQAAKDLQTKIPAFENVESGLQKLKSMSGFQTLPTKEKGEVESLSKSLLLDIKGLAQTGALDKGTIEVTDEILGNPNALFQSQQSGRLDSYLEKIREAKERALSQGLINYQPLQLRKQ